MRIHIPGDTSGHEWYDKGANVLECALCSGAINWNIAVGYISTCPAASVPPPPLPADPITPTLPFATLDSFFGPVEPRDDATARCISCARVLSSTLDAYYGTDAYEREQCEPCRRTTARAR